MPFDSPAVISHSKDVGQVVFLQRNQANPQKKKNTNSRGAAMTLNKFDFAATTEAKAYGAAITARVEAGREAIEPAAKRAAAPQPGVTA